MPGATPQELAVAIFECIEAGARVINLSLALVQSSTRGEQALEESLNHALSRGVIVIVAAGNQNAIGGSAITRHPWVIPVVACDLDGRPMKESNFGDSIGRWGLSAPGDNITSLGSEGQSLTLGGTSVAAPFVTGTLRCSGQNFLARPPRRLSLHSPTWLLFSRWSVVPPLLDATAAYQILSAGNTGRPAA